MFITRSEIIVIINKELHLLVNRSRKNFFGTKIIRLHNLVRTFYYRIGKGNIFQSNLLAYIDVAIFDKFITEKELKIIL